MLNLDFVRANMKANIYAQEVLEGVPVKIGGTSYVPQLPIEIVVIERIDEIRSQNKEPLEVIGAFLKEHCWKVF